MKLEDLYEAKPTPTSSLTQKQIVDFLKKALVGKKIKAFGKDSKGLWGKSDTEIEFTIDKMDSSYYDEESGFLSIDVYPKGYLSKNIGLIYTDPKFEKNLQALLKLASPSYKKDAVSYSEQGMQGSNFVNLDVSVAKLGIPTK